jgi:hypothetical protein
MINYKYFIYLYCNRKKQKIIHKSAKRSTILEIWRELKTEKKPPYVKTNSGRKRESTNYELALIFPNTRWSTKTFIKDDMGRNLEATIDNDKQRIKELIPYWVEELVYDFDAKKRIRYHELIEQFILVKDIAQVFTLNNKIFLQVDNNVKMFGNKNLDDSDRLFAIIRDDLLKRKKSNFIFVKDITTHQRKLLYNLLVEKGYKRTELFRHYSY